MADPNNNARRNWLDNMRERRRSLQQQLEAVELGETDTILAGKVRGMISEIRALTASIEDAEKFFQE